jgi:hypothetical protein
MPRRVRGSTFNARPSGRPGGRPLRRGRVRGSKREGSRLRRREGGFGRRGGAASGQSSKRPSSCSAGDVAGPIRGIERTPAAPRSWEHVQRATFRPTGRSAAYMRRPTPSREPPWRFVVRVWVGADRGLGREVVEGCGSVLPCHAYIRTRARWSRCTLGSVQPGCCHLRIDLSTDGLAAERSHPDWAGSDSIRSLVENLVRFLGSACSSS